MNLLECRMVDMLKELKEEHGAIGVKAEFEAEGTRLDELLRLKEICMVAGLDLILKIGGCESLRDMLESRVLGVNYLVAPMVESAYALRKYLQAINKVFPAEERERVKILCNIETAKAISVFEEMLAIPEINTLSGIVVERVDLCFSLGLDDQSINDPEINQIVLEIVKKAKKSNLFCIVGGGVSAHSLPFIRTAAGGYIDGYETRKVCFSAAAALANNPEKGILKALGFELFWLRNMAGFYKGISLVNKQRMSLIEDNYWKTSTALI